MTRQTRTAEVRGRELPHSRDTQITVHCTREQHDRIKAAAVRDCRTIGNQVLYYALQAIEAK